MSNEIIVDVISEVAKEQSKEIYEDGFKGATQEMGGALETIVGLFNNVILYPLKKVNIEYSYKIEKFKETIIEKYKSIPENERVEPPMNIVGPAIEALKYTYDTDELRDMYIKLLTSTMDINTIEYAHPSFVDVIKQMSPLDAKIFKIIDDKSGNVAYCEITIGFDKYVYTYGMPKVFTPDFLIETYDPYVVSASVENLIRLGLIKTTEGLSGKDISYILMHEYVEKRLDEYKRKNPGKIVKKDYKEKVIGITDFGRSFAITCVRD